MAAIGQSCNDIGRLARRNARNAIGDRVRLSIFTLHVRREYASRLAYLLKLFCLFHGFRYLRKSRGNRHDRPRSEPIALFPCNFKHLAALPTM
jgi:hypothetical protein